MTIFVGSIYAYKGLLMVINDIISQIISIYAIIGPL